MHDRLRGRLHTRHTNPNRTRLASYNVAATSDKDECHHDSWAKKVPCESEESIYLVDVALSPSRSTAADGHCVLCIWVKVNRKPHYRHSSAQGRIGKFLAMPTLDQPGLTHLLETLSISAPTSDVVEAAVLSNPLDLGRTALAELLANIVDCDIQAAFKSIQWPNNIFNGDLSVTVPKLCPGRKPAEVSSQLVDKV